ncbi:HpcH/HpaI aldolase/citrate lyase family protein [Sulfitobacter sp. W074]|uniref:HpcH/HpaI aldolase family protein n=1 Tax=Sulfitobacter sp. W074 TaxID=2867026 RepID=UPI0021A477F4|nr:HpcH/HpaI aldolase/citrate lyase family protein [Sulfitobacter sp. W074]UWR39350.1 HpcH/HpaI aldolase/citrate lyase family protein [Sulfitobacter sp. W074]
MSGKTLKQSLRQGSRLSGFWLSLCSPTVTEIAAGSGIDWLLLDMEHAPNDLSQITDHLRAAGSANPNAQMVVRMPSSDQTMTKRLLDIGVQNLMFPMVQNAEDARRAVSWTRYPPEGLRGISATIRANNYARQTDYLTTYTDAQCVIVQVETPEAVDQIPAIAAVAGVDAIFIGPGDLSSAMGHTGNPMHPDVQDKIREAVDAIHAAGLPAGILGYSADLARRYFDNGIEFVAIAGDAWLLTRQMDALVQTMAQPSPTLTQQTDKD